MELATGRRKKKAGIRSEGARGRDDGKRWPCGRSVASEERHGQLPARNQGSISPILPLMAYKQ